MGLLWQGCWCECCRCGWGRPWEAKADSSPRFSPQGIADYISRCKQAIGKFESLVHQIHKNADDISGRLMLIESMNLFKFPARKSEDELPSTHDSLFL